MRKLIERLEKITEFKRIEVTDSSDKLGYKRVSWDGYHVDMPSKEVKGFVDHKETMGEIIGCGAMSRDKYETMAKRLRVKAYPDEELGIYGDKYGNYSMYQYDKPENRKGAITAQLRQQRWMGIEKERHDEKKEKSSVHSTGQIKPTGQLWEPCSKCGHEPSYMPLGLCKKCWPSQER